MSEEVREEVCEYCNGEKVIVVQSAREKYPCILCALDTVETPEPSTQDE